MAQAQRCLYMGDQINHLWKIAHLLWNHCIERMLCVGVLDAMTMTMLTTMMIVLMIMIMIYRSKSSKPATRCWYMLDLLGRHYTFPSICDDVCCTWKIAVSNSIFCHIYIQYPCYHVLCVLSCYLPGFMFLWASRFLHECVLENRKLSNFFLGFQMVNLTKGLRHEARISNP